MVLIVTIYLAVTAAPEPVALALPLNDTVFRDAHYRKVTGLTKSISSQQRTPGGVRGLIAINHNLRQFAPKNPRMVQGMGAFARARPRRRAPTQYHC